MASEENKLSTLVFDDDDLKRILYGYDLPGPSPADQFLPVKQLMVAIRQAVQQNDTHLLVSKLNLLVASNTCLYEPICKELLGIVAPLVPQIPLPVLDNDMSQIAPLLDKIWVFAISKSDTELAIEAGNSLYRCYEHLKQFKQSQIILHRLIEMAHQLGRKESEAVYLNNLAFQYLLTQQWQEAMPLFQRSARLFHEIGDTTDYANSRANYLSCLEQTEPIEVFADKAEELIELYRILSENNNWRVRKPLVLLARIREWQGSFVEAIELVTAAIEASQSHAMQWTEIDRTYLEQLHKLAGRHPA